MACVDGEARQVSFVKYYAENLPWKLISYGKSEESGYDELFYNGHKRHVVRRSEGCKVLVWKRIRTIYWW